MNEESKKAMTDEEFNEWFNAKFGEVADYDELTDALLNSDELTQETIDRFLDGDYDTNNFKIAVDLSSYIDSLNRIRNLSFKIIVAMTAKKHDQGTIFTDDFVEYAVREIDQTADVISIRF